VVRKRWYKLLTVAFLIIFLNVVDDEIEPEIASDDDEETMVITSVSKKKMASSKRNQRAFHFEFDDGEVSYFAVCNYQFNYH